MQESDVLAFSAETRLLIDEANARGAAAIERRGEVIDDETDVVDSRTTFGDELADR